MGKEVIPIVSHSEGFRTKGGGGYSHLQYKKGHGHFQIKRDSSTKNGCKILAEVTMQKAYQSLGIQATKNLVCESEILAKFWWNASNIPVTQHL